MTIISARYTDLPVVKKVLGLVVNVGVLVALNFGKTVDSGKLSVTDDGVIGLAVELLWLFVP